MPETVKVYYNYSNVGLNSLNSGYYGDFVRCLDCGTLMLISCGGEICGKCNSDNLIWYDEDKPEWDISELEEAGFIIEDVLMNL